MRRRFSAVSAAVLLCCSLGGSPVAWGQEPPPRAEAADDQAGSAALDERLVPFDRRWLEPFFTSGSLRAPAERFRLDDWGGAAAGFEKGIAALPVKSAERPPAQFLFALARMNRGEFAEAAVLFEALHESYPLLRPYHAYYAARCRLRQGDTAAALVWASRVPAGSVSEAEATLVKIDALVSEQKWPEVEAETSRFLERFPAGPRRAEALFQRAQSLEKLGRPRPESGAIYRQIWSEAPGEWARRAEERIEALAAGLPATDATRLRTPTAPEWVKRGLELFERNQNAEAEATMSQALGASGLDPALACKAHFHRAQSVFKQRQRPRAAPLFVQAEAACRAAGDKDLLVKSLYQGARCHSTVGDRGTAIAMYAKVEAEFPDHSYADDARLRAAEIATEAGDETQAAALLAELPNRYPKGDQASEALWRLAFKAWRAGDLERAQSWLEETLRRYPREEIWYAEGRALYWRARVLERQTKPDEARASYERAVREYPLSVYALLSFERLRRSHPAARTALLRELRDDLEDDGTFGTEAQKEDRGRGKGRRGEDPIWQFAPRAVFGEPGFLRAVELARLGIGSDARRELAKLGFSVPESRAAAQRAAGGLDGREDVLWITAVLLDRGRAWGASHSIPRYALTEYRRRYPAGRGGAEWRISYPRAFPEFVTKHATAAGVPPALQWAIMREESAFSPRIESFANALGLTQLLVKTAERFSEGRVTRETLFDPGNNLQIGSRYLSFLLDRYGGAAPLAIGGYNAGEGAVDRWLRQFGDLALDEFMETIPFDETRNYTKRVLASYFAYSWLYMPREPVPELSFSLAPPQPERAGRKRRVRR